MRAARLALLSLTTLLVLASPAAAITGGSVTTTSWPHMTAVEFASEDLLGNRDFSFGCGGSLVRPDVVLTAAHCVSDEGMFGSGPDTIAARDVRVQFPPTRPDGTRRRSDGGERVDVTQVLEHPAYDDSDAGGSDVALLKLAAPATTARAIGLAAPADAAPGREATVIGWGAQAFQGPPEDSLREAQFPIVSDEDCEGFSASGSLDRPTQVCAGNFEGGEDSCQGDSGGPLMVQDGSGAWTLAGVVSQGVGCGTPSQYGVYADVANDPLRSWVESNASALSTADDAQPASGSGSGSASESGSGSQPPPTTASEPVQTTVASGSPVAAGTLPGSGSRRASLRLPSALGSLRTARRRGAFLLGLRFNAPVTVTASLRRGGRLLARGSRRALRTGTLRMRLTRAGRRARAGRAVLSVVAVDGRGRRYRASRAVRITR